MPNWKQLYTNVSIMLDKYQNEIVPDLRAQLAEMNLSRPNVVRCKDCKHYKKISCASHTRMCFSDRGLCSASEDDYCSRGERRDNG